MEEEHFPLVKPVYLNSWNQDNMVGRLIFSIIHRWVEILSEILNEIFLATWYAFKMVQNFATIFHCKNEYVNVCSGTCWRIQKWNRRKIFIQSGTGHSSQTFLSSVKFIKSEYFMACDPNLDCGNKNDCTGSKGFHVQTWNHGWCCLHNSHTRNRLYTLFWIKKF